MVRNSRSIEKKPQLHRLQETPGQLETERERGFDARSPHRATQLASRRGLTNGDQVQKGREGNPRAFKSPPVTKGFPHLHSFLSPQKDWDHPGVRFGGVNPRTRILSTTGREKRTTGGLSPAFQTEESPSLSLEVEKKADASRESHAKMVSVVLLPMGSSLIANCGNKFSI